MPNQIRTFVHNTRITQEKGTKKDMDYRNYAIDLLKRKTQLEAAYESLGYELEMLENEK